MIQPTHDQRLLTWTLIVPGLIASFAVGQLRAGDTPIPAATDAWVKRLPDLDGITRVEEGRLHIGPYRDGVNPLRLETREPVRPLSGSVEGEYRTSGLVPMESKVLIGFYAGDKRLAVTTFQLAAPADWTAFSVPIRAPRRARIASPSDSAFNIPPMGSWKSETCGFRIGPTRPDFPGIPAH